MITYFSTFISGFSSVIETALKKSIPDTKVEQLFDGLIIYKTNHPLEEVQKIPYFNNTFVMVSQCIAQTEDSTASLVKKLYLDEDFFAALQLVNFRKVQSFRIVISRENQLVSIHKEIVMKIVDKIRRQTRLAFNPVKADHEIWFLIRREGLALSGIRVASLKPKKEYKKGELKTELAHLLCVLSDPQPSEVVLDPFCGSGAIPVERARAFPYKQIIAGDNDQKQLQVTRMESKTKNNIKVMMLDALHMTSIADHTIDKIVTDPPWGLFKDLDDTETFYRAMLKEFKRVLKKQGMMVILTSQKETMDVILKEESELQLVNKLDILVSGKKSGVYIVNS